MNVHSRGKPKIRAPRRTLVTNDDDFQTTWSQLEASFGQIHSKNASSISYETLYRLGYRLVLKRKGEELYNGVANFERKWLTNNVQAEVKSLLAPSLLAPVGSGAGALSTVERRELGERFLRGLKQAYQDHQVCMNMLGDVLMYLDRVYCGENHVPSIYTRAMQLFRECVLDVPAEEQNPHSVRILDVVNSIILEQVQMERDGEIIEKNILKSCVYMLEGLFVDAQESEEKKLYNVTFEPLFLRMSRDFYHDEAERLIREFDAGGYCRQTKKRLGEELDRCCSTLSESTTQKIQAVVEEELITNKLNELINMDSGANYMIINDKAEDLGLLYDLNAQVDNRKGKLSNAIHCQIIAMGDALNATILDIAASGPQAANGLTDAAIQWVDRVLTLKDKFDRFHEVSFRSDHIFQTTLAESFHHFINAPAFGRAAEFISLFIDENMKRGIKDKTDAEVDEVLEKAVVLIRYLKDQDSFEMYYKKHLSKRLLMHKSVSLDAEKLMISRMKMELGNNFTYKLESMFKDMSTSEGLTSDYKDYVSGLESTGPRRVDMIVSILTGVTWPLESASSMEELSNKPQQKVIYPDAVNRAREDFEKFYGQRHAGRILFWQPNMGTADMTVRFPGKNGSGYRQHELSVPTYGMIILMLFADLPSGESLSFAEIQAGTNIPPKELSRNLQALSVAPKTRILRKEPMSREVNETDRFFFNEGFTSQFKKVKVGLIAMRNRAETVAEQEETKKAQDKQRALVIEAAMVRIMKGRKTLSYSQLLSATIDQLSSRFKPEISMMKARIDALIDREYLARVDDASPPAVRYVA
ncbi:Cullin-domain-containing protein [Trichodelitschia bisporula]|uniref:Cullin-domain-containing protein n=1 Tax=Trichodelitschia bisporula TaxID=703511 RepID=A0A6G1I2U8_9PEZI|nr:Cullin-domain-containing protein [Trichodelitschia bisporula]